MTLTYFNDINVYFHMKNHYKMLKQVKSVIDTSIPQSLLKSPLAMPNSQKQLKGTTNEHLRKIYNSPAIFMPKREGQVKRHNCLNSEAKSEASLRTGSLPSRPTTRRNPIVTPKETLPLRSCSVGPPTRTKNMFKFRQKKRPSVSSTRSSNAENQNANLQLDLEKENTNGSVESPSSTKRSPGSKSSINYEMPEKSPKTAESPFLKESSEEHEYLLFLLRITEDIIVNDFYSNNNIMQVFKFHIESNKHRLNVRKMHFHIENLCKELNIECKGYQTETNEKNELDSPLKFKNSPTSRSGYLNNEAFLNCLDCSAIRTSSLYKMPPSISEHAHQVGDSIEVSRMDDNDSSISPSLLRLLEKLSLGRVTECTEPVASTSTMNSPNCLMLNNFEKEEGKIGDKGKSPMDFDTFVKELNSKEDILVLPSKNYTDNSLNLNDDIIALESPPAEIYNNLIRNNPLENTDLGNQCDVRSPKILPENILNEPNLSSENSKSEIEISGKDLKSFTNSEKYESEFENSTSSNSIFKGDNSKKKSDEEKVKHDEKTREKKADSIPSEEIIVLNKSSNDKSKEAEETVDNTGDFITSVEDNRSPVNNSSNRKSPLGMSPVKIVEFQDKDTGLLDSLKTDRGDQSQVKIALNLNPINVDQFPDKGRGDPGMEIIHNQTDLSGQPLVTTTSFGPTKPPDVDQPRQFSQNTNNEASPKRQEPQISSRKSSNPSENQDTILKVFLQGALNDSDYVMIRGPVYVYKPLLDSEPKLVVFNPNPKSRQNSIASQHSNKTFTVDNSHARERIDADQQVEPDNVDEAIQFDQSLHSLADDSMENILELTRRAYSQFTDSKLLQSDYDLTPQKDSDNKYHHLLVDASTSVSGVNIKESLLLSDDYLVKNDEGHQKLNEQQVYNVATVPDDQKSVNDIDSYLKMEPKLFDNDYVMHRNGKLMASASMPKLMMANDSSGDLSYETLDGRDRNEFKSGQLLLGYSGDLINFDIPSQDSSLRSEGETSKY